MPGSVTVITPTVGGPELVDALISVAEQDYEGEVTHLVVVDGKEHLSKVAAAIEISGVYPTLLVLPENTGFDGWIGHRIYASVPMLVNTDYIAFLDQDNWYTENHLSSAIKAMEDNFVDMAFSLRSIYSKEKEYLCDDNCESLGLWPVWNSNDDSYLMDTSTYVFKKDLIQATCHLWRHKLVADRIYTNEIKKILNNNFVTTGLRTLCYRLGGRDESVSAQFFIEGNKRQEAKYFCGPFPWLRQYD
jgi:hypothetical protein